MPPLRGLALFFILAASAWAQNPFILSAGVVNGASFMPQGAPGAGIAQGSIFSVFGLELSDPADASASFPIPTELAGVRVEISTSSGLTWDAPLFSAGERQINGLLPSDVPVGEASFVVVRDGVRSNAVTAKIVRSSVGIFIGVGYGRPRLAGRAFQPALQPGDAVTIWATGLGPIAGSDRAAPPIGDLPARIEVFVAGRQAEILYQGRSGCCAGVDQINFRIPDSTPSSCFTPLWVRVSGALYSNVVTLDVGEGGGACKEEQDGRLQPFLFDVSRVYLHRSVNAATSETTNDARGAFYGWISSFVHYPLLPIRLDDPTLAPPIEDCVVPYLGVASPYSGTSSGPVSVSAPSGSFDLLPAPAQPPGEIGLPTHVVEGDAPSLVDGVYRVERAASEDQSGFSVSLNVEPPLSWSGFNPVQLQARTSGLSIRWSPLNIGAKQVHVSGRSESFPAEAGPDLFTCRGGGPSGALTVPPAVLANVPTQTLILSQSDVTSEPMNLGPSSAEPGAVTYLHETTVELDIGRPHLPSSPVRLPNGVEIQAELAITFGEKQRGLMFRPELRRDQGMLFLYDTLGSRRFWMLNTLVPLDIIFLDADHRIVFISADTPVCAPEQSSACPTYGPSGLSQSVLELAAGEAARQSLVVGSRLEW